MTNTNEQLPDLSRSVPDMISQSFATLIMNAVPLFGVLKLGWSSVALVLVFILEGVFVFFTDVVKFMFQRKTANLRMQLLFEFAFIFFYGFFAMIVFGPYDSLEEMISDKFRRIGEIIISDIGRQLLVIFSFRIVRLIKELITAGALGNSRKSKLEFSGGGWMLLLFFAVILAPILARSGPNPIGGLIAIIVLKTMGELFMIWAPGMVGTKKGI